ncbi:hypothetical protein GCM10007049_16380 [Echinicola pacifica]|uniref:GH16 domain-containing protein n=2 Tax=Echinicola pacifica TaxID=346377 RepID=A0A918UNN1_9BACT|nr:hypothetical protein GCM10007049_16380 [Echinicola pacifica]
MAPEMCVIPLEGQGSITATMEGLAKPALPASLKHTRLSLSIILAVLSVSCTSQAEPTSVDSSADQRIISPSFLPGQDPLNSTASWSLVGDLSDEFDQRDSRSSSGLNVDKWTNGPTEYFPWQGSTQCLFSPSTVQVDQVLAGAATITVQQLAEKQGDREYAGGIIRSTATAKPGMYMEARMRANKTQMSSSFWLINVRKYIEEECKRTTELDIQESVGQRGPLAEEWSTHWDQMMHSNVLNRETTEACSPLENARNQNKKLLSQLASEDFQVFGCWWKDPNTFIFFLNGEEVYQLHPKSGEFIFPMFITLSSNVYDWNKYPKDQEGMAGFSEIDRSTAIDWVRTWSVN